MLGVDPLLLALGVAALLVGATGTWSPCGFSMIETLGPRGHVGGRPTTIAACATFGPFAVAGGVLTFGSLALLGAWLHGGAGTLAYALAALVAIGAAIAEWRGLPIVPRVRRQLPVGWRQRLPMPVAAAGYGGLLGLGFTTFVLSWGVWALIGISLALGDPLAGLVLGAAFGTGRALPIVILAPLADRPAGERACDAMAMRPELYRGARLGDAVALTLLAALLAGNATALGAERVERQAADPSVSGRDLAFQRADRSGVLRRGGRGPGVALPGTDPAIGGPYLAVLDDDGISIRDRETLAEAARIGARAGSADAVAISRRFVVWRVQRDRRDVVIAARLGDRVGAPRPGRPTQIASARHPAQIGLPSIAGGRLVFARHNARRNRLVETQLGARKGNRARVRRSRTIRGSRRHGLSNPSVRGNRIAYVQTTIKRQRVRVAGLRGGAGRIVHSRRTGRGHIWSLALAADRVYITLLGGGGGSQILAADR